MTRINLLPWREARRRERERRFFTITLSSLAAAGAVFLYAHVYMSDQIEHQNSRNTFLASEIEILDRQIGEINNLAAEKARLLARMTIIQELQSSRPAAVHVFNDLVTTLPDGLYYKSVKLQGTALTLEGISQSNATVSTLMRNLATSTSMENPVLELIEAKEADKLNGARYVMHVAQKVAKPPAAEENPTATPDATIPPATPVTP